MIYSTPKSKQNYAGIGCITIIFLALIIGAVVSLVSPSAPTNTSNSPAVTKQKTGIDAVAFDKMVREKLNEINNDGLVSRVETTVYGETGTVKMHLADLVSWSVSPDVEKKEFVNTMGKLMDAIASITALPGTETIAVSTRIYSPSGLELAERTIWGDVKLK